MESIGNYLKEIREAKNISLEKAAKETKILKEHLEQLENNDFSKISGSTYIKGFLKTYGEYLGLSSEVLLQEYEKTYSKQENKKGFSLLSNYQKMELALMTIEAWKPKIKKLLILLCLIAIGTVGVKIFPHINNPFKSLATFKLPSLQSTPEPASKSDILSDLERIENKQDLNKKKPTPNYPVVEKSANQANTTQTKKLVLKAIATNNVWLSLKIDNRLIFEDLFRKDNQESWKANESFELIINQPKNITFYYNNKEIEELKNFDSPKKLIINEQEITVTNP